MPDPGASWWDGPSLELRREMLFGERVVLCRTHRPNDVHAMFCEAVACAPDGEALIDGELRLDWRSLAAIVTETAAGLTAHGIAKGDRVALLVGNRAEFVIAFYAIARLGAVSVPISTREQMPGIAFALNHSGAKLLIHESAFIDRLPARAEVPALSVYVPLGAGHSGAPFSVLRSKVPLPEVEIDQEDVAVLLYTSGTTGKPKGAMVAHVNIVHAALIYEHTMELGRGERSVVAVPLTHVTGISGMIASMARCAGALIIMPEFKAPLFMVLAARERMTHTILVPAMYALCIDRSDFSAHDLSAWRIGAYGGAPMPAPCIEALAKRLPALRLMNLYGSTETVSAQAIMPPAHAYDHREDVGVAAPGGEVLIMDDDGRECRHGEAGEIWLRNASVVRGYWNDPAATADNLISGYWRSGDIGRIDKAGFIRVLDRIKDMINRGGYKIYTAEVESVLAEHPAVLECAVVAKSCPVLGERVHAFVALRGVVREDELAAFCRARLADYKRPESFTLSHSPLPRNANGKLMKREMRAVLPLEAVTGNPR